MFYSSSHHLQAQRTRLPRTRVGRWLLPLGLLSVLLTAMLVRPATSTHRTARVLHQLLVAATTQPAANFRVIITRQRADQAGDMGVHALGGHLLRELGHGAFVAELPGRAVATLGHYPGVKYVALDAPAKVADIVDPSYLATLYPYGVHAAQLWSDTQPSTGLGIGVAVLDTGINKDLSDFRNAKGQSRVVAQTKFNSNTNSQADGHGHGTHVAGIIAGNSWWQPANSGLQGKYIGVAPEANLVNVKVSDDQGVSYISDIVNAIDWVVQNRQTYNIRVMNLSLLSTVAESYQSSTLDAAVERAWFSGILVTVAAGNGGPNSVQYPPANDPFVVTVGAADPMNTPGQGDDTIAPWSSYGTTQDAVSKPDIVATGRYMVAPLAGPQVSLAKLLPARVVENGRYIRLSGTSMAAPVVAGAVALIFQAHPTWTNDQAKWALLHTSVPLGTGSGSHFVPYPGQGSGEVQTAAAVGYTGVPLLANQGLRISPQLSGPNGATIYTQATNATSTWSTSTWSTSTWSTSTWSTSTWSTSTWSTETTLENAPVD